MMAASATAGEQALHIFNQANATVTVTSMSGDVIAVVPSGVTLMGYVPDTSMNMTLTTSWGSTVVKVRPSTFARCSLLVGQQTDRDGTVLAGAVYADELGHVLNSDHTMDVCHARARARMYPSIWVELDDDGGRAQCASLTRPMPRWE
jgi:hypothetical protein